MKSVIKAASQAVMFFCASLAMSFTAAYLLWTVWALVSESVREIRSEEVPSVMALIGSTLVVLGSIAGTWICGFLGFVAFRLGWFTLDEVPKHLGNERADT